MVVFTYYTILGTEKCMATGTRLYRLSPFPSLTLMPSDIIALVATAGGIEFHQKWLKSAIWLYFVTAAFELRD